MLLKSLIDRSTGNIVRPCVATPRVSATVATNANQELRLEDNFISDLITKYDNTTQPKRVTDDYIHVSSLRDMCPRQYAIMAKSGDPHYDRINTNDKLVWAIGRAVEKYIRNTYIESVDYIGVYGQWVCSCNKSTHIGFHDKDAVCDVCGKHLNKYMELPLFDNDNRIVGNPDIVLCVNGKYLPVEIKSVKGGSSKNKSLKFFDDLVEAPTGDHIFQAQMYRYLLQKNGFPVADEVVVIYGCKDYSFRSSPLKQFNVDVSTPSYESIVANAVLSANRIFSYLLGGSALPERLGLCTSVSDKVPSKCPVVGRCFA